MGTKQFDNYADLITFTRASGATYLDSDGVLKTASTNIPRIEYDADGNRLGLLVEEQRTNFFTYSEDFSNAAWIKSNASIDSNVIVAPDGTLTGDKLVENVNSGLHQLGEVQAVSASSHSFSVYIKKAERTWVRLSLAGASYAAAYGTYGTNRSAYFDLENGAKGTIGSAFTASTISTVGNDWYRISVTFVGTNNVDNEHQIAIAQGDLDVTTYAGDNTSGIYVWGAQLEAGAFPTSYIPTSGSTATRAADVASITGADFKKWFNADEGTVYVEWGRNVTLPSGQFKRIWSIDDGTTSNRIRVFESSTTAVAADYRNSGTYYSNETSGTPPTAGTTVKAAYGFSPTGGGFTVGGASPDTFSSLTPAVVDRITFGNEGAFDNSYALSGTIKSIKYYPRRLTNAQLQELTQ